MIAQKEGIQLKRLTALNLLSTDEVPLAGDVLQLQFPAAKKPAVTIVPSAAHSGNDIIVLSAEEKTAALQRDSDYITLKKPVETQPAADSGFMHTTDTATGTATTKVPAKTRFPARPAAFPKPTPTAPVEQAPPPIVVVTTKAPENKAAPLHWVTSDTLVTIKKETQSETEQQARHDELAELKAQMDKVVYADDSKLVASIQSEQPIAKKTEEQPASTKSTKFYTVKKGDTAFSIAKKNNITVKELLKWNDIDADEIKIGKKLKLTN